MLEFRSWKILELGLENAYQGIIVIDEKGLVRYLNRTMEQLSGIKWADLVGKHVTVYSKFTRLHKVLETGKAELGIKCQRWNNVILDRIPIYEKDRIIGVIGLFLFREKELFDLVEKLNRLELKIKNYEHQIRSMLAADYGLEDIIGESNEIKNCKESIQRMAKTDSTILITGESGTGKEMFAHAAHTISNRKDKPFVKINCAAIPMELIESELFGYEPGTFTGASKRAKIGKFQLADGGTLFLDEVGDMSLQMQAKVLRVLQSKEVERVGGNHSYKIDFRVIAATNKDLTKLIGKGSFRTDLYYRLNVMPIHILPLRERTKDIELLTTFFLQKESQSQEKSPSIVSPDTMLLLKSYPWPGNVRELSNVLSYAVCSANGNMIESRHLPSYVTETFQDIQQQPDRMVSLGQLYRQTERAAINLALSQAKNNKTTAARLLKIHRSTLYKKIDALGHD